MKYLMIAAAICFLRKESPVNMAAAIIRYFIGLSLPFYRKHFQANGKPPGIFLALFFHFTSAVGEKQVKFINDSCDNRKYIV